MKSHKILTIILLSFLALAGYGWQNDSQNLSNMMVTSGNSIMETGEKTNDIAGTFYVPENISYKNWTDEFDITQCYITNKVVGQNQYYIDENHILWGCGRNDCGQLGLNHPEDTNNSENVYTDYQKIAENVVHVDCSVNSYFVVYLTESGDLYGIGENLYGVLLNEIGPDDELNPWLNIVYKPKLLMSDVAYVSTGKDSIAALKNNGEAYWWGTFLNTSATDPFVLPMRYDKPHLMVDHAKFVSCGDLTAAAVTEDNTLYTWGNNLWGQCGVESEDDYVYEAQKVAENVIMAWTEEIMFNAPIDYWEPYWAFNYGYSYDNTFILKEDDQMYACGKNIGNQKKTLHMSGDLEQDETAVYSTQFLPIRIEEAFLPPEE